LDRNFWVKMIVKIVAIMLLPLSMRFETGSFGSYLYYDSIIMTIGTDPMRLDFDPSPGVYPSLNLDMLILVSALVLCAPGISFDYWVSRQPRARSIKKQLFAATVFTQLMIFPVGFLLLAPLVGPDLYLYGNSLLYLPTWILIVLVLLPIFTREGSFIDTARRRESVNSTTGHQRTTISRFIGKGMLMALIVGVVALCVPFRAFAYSWPGGENLMSFLSTSWSGHFGSWNGFSYFEVAPLSYVSILIPTFLIMPLDFMISSLITPLVFLFNLLFGYSVLLYLQSRTSIVRAALYGILGMGVPFAIHSMQFLMPGAVTDFTMQYIPLPVLQAVGVLLVFFVDPTRQDERIWEDTDDRMWFDQGDQDAGKATERKPKVTIPLTYILTSKIRALLNGSNNRTLTTDPHNADWTQDEEIWT